MTDFFWTAPKYITAQDVKDSTNVTDLASETSTNIIRWINEAQAIVDEYVWYIFKDIVPLDVKKAMIYVVESRYLKGPPLAVWEGAGKIKSEKNLDRSVTYTEGLSRDSILDIPEEAEQLLKPYKSCAKNDGILLSDEKITQDRGNVSTNYPFYYDRTWY